MHTEAIWRNFQRFDKIFLWIFFFKIMSADWTVKFVFKDLIRVVLWYSDSGSFLRNQGKFFLLLVPPKERIITEWNSNLTVHLVCTGYFFQDWGIVFFSLHQYEISDGQKFAQFVQIKKKSVDLIQNNLQRKDLLLWMMITCWSAYKNNDLN